MAAVQDTIENLVESEHEEIGTQKSAGDSCKESFTEEKTDARVSTDNEELQDAETDMELVHEEQFRGMDIKDVLQGDIELIFMDRYAYLLMKHFKVHMRFPQALYSSTTQQRSCTIRRVPKEEPFVQIHYVINHYVVSAQIDEQLYVFDSIEANEHHSVLLRQLTYVYDEVDESLIQYRVLQSQGAERLCGCFAAANAFAILKCIQRNIEIPKETEFDTTQMRQHFHDCLETSQLSAFPFCKQLQSTDGGKHLIGMRDESLQSIAHEVDVFKDGQGIPTPTFIDSGKQNEKIVHNRIPRGDMQVDLDFRETLECLQSCRSVQDASDILQQITAATIGVVIPATQEKVDLIVREIEERLRQGENPSDVDLSPEIQEELKKFLESFIVPQQKQYENVDRPKEDKSARQLCRQISEETEKEMKLIASHLGKTFLDKTVSEENSGVEVTDVKILESETCDETDFKFASLVEPLDSSITASENVSLHAQTETLKDRTTNKDLRTNISIFGDGQQFEHYIKSHIDCDAFNWRIIEGVSEFVVQSLHVLFGSPRIKEIQNEGGDVENLKHLDVCRQFYQKLGSVCKCGVHYIYDGKKVGETKRAIYKQGEQGDYSAEIDKSGCEIALVKMDHGEEISMDLPEGISKQWKELDMGTELKFKGKCKNYHDIPLDSDVYKIGKQTGLTKGVITKKNEPYKFFNGVLFLFNQIVVEWGNVPFSEPGDSGSMVFTVENGEIISIGIVVGSVEEKKLSTVTPISEILDYISEKNKAKYDRLKHFMLKTDGRIVKKIITDKIIKTMLPRTLPNPQLYAV